MKNENLYPDMVPEGSIPMFGLRIISYLTSTGDLAFKLALDEDGSTSVAQVVGVLDLAKFELMLGNTLKRYKDAPKPKDDE